MQATVPGLDIDAPRKRFTPSQMLPKPQGELPTVYGVDPNFRQIAGLQIASGRFFTPEEAAQPRPCACSAKRRACGCSAWTIRSASSSRSTSSGIR